MSQNEIKFLYDYLKVYDFNISCYSLDNETKKQAEKEQKIVLHLIKKLEKEIKKLEKIK